MKLKFTLLFFCLAIGLSSYAQQNEPVTENFSVTITPQYVPSIASRMSQLEGFTDVTKEAQDGRSSGNIVVIGKDPQTENDFFAANPHYLKGKIPGKAPILVFDAASSSSQPTDPSLAVGPDHVFVVFNTGFTIYDKAGVQLLPQTSPNPAIFPSGGCCDLTVSFDNAASNGTGNPTGRWVVSFLGSGAQVAVSDGPDPLTSGWNVYNIPQINDYQKLSVWSDAYYMTDNTGGPNRIYVMERDEMIAGNPAQIIGLPLPGIVTSGFYSPQALSVSNDELPSAGNATIVYLQDDAWSGVSTDHLKLWNVNVDWTTGSGIVDPAVELTTTAFISVFDGGSFSNLTQPGGGIAIDALQATIMNQAQFRKFPSHNSALINFVVDTDATGGELAGIRWFELRQAADGAPWTIFQEDTYTAPDGRHAWHASMMMDTFGNIGMGYTSMAGPTTPNPTDFRVSSYYTGRFANDPLNTMTIAEELIAAGNANIPGLRYGDYSKIDVDPADDKTFWFINEYMNSGRKDVVGVFKIAPDFDNDVGVVSIDAPVDGSLTASENVTVTIFNFGENPQSAIPVSLTVDGNLIATEVFPGPLASATSAQYTFTTPADFSMEGQTYNVVASTDLTTDEDTTNDSASRDITHILNNDVGVIAITSPVSGEGLGTETVTVTIENFGTQPQSNFDVQYTLDGGAPVIETVAGPLAPGTTLSFSFAQTADLSAVGVYQFIATTLLSNDGDGGNNSKTKNVQNIACTSLTNDTQMPIGPNANTVTESVISFTDDFIIEDVNVTLNLNHTYTGDLDIFLFAPDGSSVELSTDNGGTGENMIGTTFDDEASGPITAGSAPFTGSYQPEGSLSDFDGMSSLGDWTLSITDDANADGGTLLDWTLQLCSEPILSVGDPFAEEAELVIVDQGNDQYQVQLLTTEFTERLNLTIHNMLGQQLINYRLNNDGNGYIYDLDMSYAASGVYIIRLGNDKVGKVKRLIKR